MINPGAGDWMQIFQGIVAERVTREIDTLEKIARVIYGGFSDDAARREFRRRAWILLAALSKHMQAYILETPKGRVPTEPMKTGLDALFNGFEKYQRGHKNDRGDVQ